MVINQETLCGQFFLLDHLVAQSWMQFDQRDKLWTHKLVGKKVSLLYEDEVPKQSVVWKKLMLLNIPPWKEKKADISRAR